MSLSPQNVQAANILVGCVSTATTIITIPAGRTWKGRISLNATATVAASGAAISSRATVSTAGATVTPAAGVVLGVYVSVPAQLSTTTGQVANSDQTDITVVAGTSAATLTLQINSASAASATASGVLL
jgi:hypothetical protein